MVIRRSQVEVNPISLSDLYKMLNSMWNRYSKGEMVLGCLHTKRPFITFTFLLLVLVYSCSSFPSTEAYDASDPNGNITIKWDVISWTPDGYVAFVTIYNYQKYRTIQAPGWKLGWTWKGQEVIWSMMGAQATEQGDCSRYKGNIPHSCLKNPNVVDLLPGTPYNQQVANCCKGGVMGSWGEKHDKAVSSFQISVGQAGTTNRTVRLPKNFTLDAPGKGYTCGAAKVVKPTRFITPDRRRVTQAMMTWNTTCTYSRFLKPEIPTCCVSLSSNNSKSITNCPTCSCGCQQKTHPMNCLNSRQGKQNLGASVKCTSHMCPIRIHWDVKHNYKNHWWAKIKITNYNYRLNFTDWNLVVKDGSFLNVTQIFGFNYKPLTYHGSFNGSTMLWGIKSFNDVIPEAGHYGNVQSEILFRKDMRTNSSSNRGWDFPKMVYFNGKQCVMPIVD